MDNERVREALRGFGYDPDDPVRGLEIPDKLTRALGKAPLVPERRIDAIDNMGQARRYVRTQEYLEAQRDLTGPTSCGNHLTPARPSRAKRSAATAASQ